MTPTFVIVTGTYAVAGLGAARRRRRLPLGRLAWLTNFS